MNKTKDPTPEKLSDLKSALVALLEKAGDEKDARTEGNKDVTRQEAKQIGRAHV